MVIEVLNIVSNYFLGKMNPSFMTSWNRIYKTAVRNILRNEMLHWLSYTCQSEKK